MFCLDPPCRLTGWHLPGSRDPRYPWVLLLGWQAAGRLFGEASGGSGEGSGAKCCCSVSVCPLPNRSRPLSASMGCDYTTHRGNLTCTFMLILNRKIIFVRQVALHSDLDHHLLVLALFQQRRRLFPFLLLPAQGLCYGDLERDAWPVQYCASQGMELLCAQSFSHCFGLYGEKVMLRISFHFKDLCVLLLWPKGLHMSKWAHTTK